MTRVDEIVAGIKQSKTGKTIEDLFKAQKESVIKKTKSGISQEDFAKFISLAVPRLKVDASKQSPILNEYLTSYILSQMTQDTSEASVSLRSSESSILIDINKQKIEVFVNGKGDFIQIQTKSPDMRCIDFYSRDSLVSNRGMGYRHAQSILQSTYSKQKPMDYTNSLVYLNAGGTLSVSELKYSAQPTPTSGVLTADYTRKILRVSGVDGSFVQQEDLPSRRIVVDYHQYLKNGALIENGITRNACSSINSFAYGQEDDTLHMLRRLYLKPENMPEEGKTFIKRDDALLPKIQKPVYSSDVSFPRSAFYSEYSLTNRAIQDIASGRNIPEIKGVFSDFSPQQGEGVVNSVVDTIKDRIDFYSLPSSQRGTSNDLYKVFYSVPHTALMPEGEGDYNYMHGCDSYGREHDFARDFYREAKFRSQLEQIKDERYVFIQEQGNEATLIKLSSQDETSIQMPSTFFVRDNDGVIPDPIPLEEAGDNTAQDDWVEKHLTISKGGHVVKTTKESGMVVFSDTFNDVFEVDMQQ